MSERHNHQSLRKHLLILRASVERAELEGRIADVRRAASPAALLHGVLPRSMTSPKGVAGFMQSNKWLRTLDMLRRHPVASSIISFVAARIPLPKKMRVVGTAVRVGVELGGLGLLAWQGWSWWKSHRANTANTTENSAANSLANSAPNDVANTAQR